MLKKILLLMVSGMISLAAHAQLEIPTMEQLLKEKKETFEGIRKEGGFEQGRKAFKNECLKRTNKEEKYCECSNKIMAAQSDEMLYYDAVVTARFINAMAEAQRALNANAFRRLQIQMTLRDGLNRRVAEKCGVYDEATKKVIPFDPPKAEE